MPKKVSTILQAALFGAAFVLNPFSVFIYEHPIRSLTVFAVLLVAALLVWKATPVQQHVLRVPIVVRISILLVILSSAVSTIFGVGAQISWWGSFTRFQGVFWLMIIGILSIELFYFFRAKHWHGIYTAIYWGGTVSALLAILQFFGLDPLTQPNRIHGTLGHPNYLAIVLLMTSTMIAVRLMRNRKWYLIAILILQWIALFLTFTRSAYVLLVATVVALIVIHFFHSPRVNRMRTTLWFGGILLGSLVFAFATSALLAKGKTLEYAIFTSTAPVFNVLNEAELAEGAANPLLDRVSSISEDSGSMQVRRALYKEGANMLRDYWLLGAGAEQILTIYPEYYVDNPDRPLIAKNALADRLHNDILDTGAQYGVLGLLGWYLLYGSIIYTGLRLLWKRRGNKITEESEMIIIGLALLVQHVLFVQLNFATLTSQLYVAVAVTGLLWVHGNRSGKKVSLREWKMPRILRAAVAIAFIFAALRFGVLPEVGSMYASALYIPDFSVDDKTVALSATRALDPYQPYYSHEESRMYNIEALNATDDAQEEELLTLAEDRELFAYDLGLRGLYYHQQMANIYVAWESINPIASELKAEHEKYIFEEIPDFGKSN